MASTAGGRTTADVDPGPDRRFRLVLAAIAAAGVVVRVAALVVFERSGLWEGLGGDGARYHLAAALVADGRGYLNPFEGVPDALHPPAWTTVLAVVDRLGLDTAVQQAMFASLLGAVTVVLLGVTGRRLASPRAGLVAAAIGAVSPALWTYERNLNAEALAFPLVTAVILTAYRYRERPGTGRLLVVALLVAVLALTRSEQILLVPFVLVPLVLGTPDLGWGSKLGRLALAGVTIVVVISPWTIYNLDRLDRPVVLSAGAGNSLIVSSCDEAFGGDLMGSYSVDCYFRAADQVGDEVGDVDRTVQDVEFRRIAMDYTLDHLDRLPAVVLAREGRSWSFFEPRQQTYMQGEQLGIHPDVILVQILLFWVLAVLAVMGAIDLRRRGVALYPLLAFPAIVVLTTATTFGDLRYRAPAEITIALLAGVAIDGRWRTAGRRP